MRACAMELCERWTGDGDVCPCAALGGERPIHGSDHVDEPKVIASPGTLEGFAEHFGIRLAIVGEDGDWLALGHVDPADMVAAMERAGDELGLDPVDVWGDDDPRHATRVVHTRAYFTEHDECGWWAHWGHEAQTHPAAVDVTVYTP